MTEELMCYGEFGHKQKWEHKVCIDEIPISPEISNLEQQGWELVSVIYKDPSFYFYFKRERLA